MSYQEVNTPVTMPSELRKTHKNYSLWLIDPHYEDRRLPISRR